MIKFSAKSKTGHQLLGIGLSATDLMKLKSGEPIIFDLASAHIGIWKREEDGTRSFQQPRDCHVMIIPGDQAEDIGEFLGVEMPSLEEIKKHTSK